MILQAKYFIFINKCKKSLSSWQAFKSNMKNKMNIERSIYNVVDISRGFMIQYFEKVDEFTIFLRSQRGIQPSSW